MKKWVLKAVVQKSISFLPFKHRINHLFQQYVTKGVQLSDAYLEDKLIHFRFHRKAYTRYYSSLAGISVFELGTGWYPVIPVCFFLNGVENITTVDIARLSSKEKLLDTISKFLDYHRSGKLSEFITYDPERMRQLAALAEDPGSTMESLLDQLKIDYQIGDAARLIIEPKSFDLIVSNNTFEHVFPKALAGLLLQFRSICQEGGVMSHFIDMSDHFAHLDSSITIYNFLRFSDQQWKWIDNNIQPQNRWRITHYRRLYSQLSLPIDWEENRPGNIEDLRSIPVHDSFRSIPEEELAISHCYLVSRL